MGNIRYNTFKVRYTTMQLKTQSWKYKQLHSEVYWNFSSSPWWVLVECLIRLSNSKSYMKSVFLVWLKVKQSYVSLALLLSYFPPFLMVIWPCRSNTPPNTPGLLLFQRLCITVPNAWNSALRLLSVSLLWMPPSHSPCWSSLSLSHTHILGSCPIYFSRGTYPHKHTVLT